MAERVDVCIVGSGFGGSIAAWRLAELYRAAGADPARILVLERGRRFKHTDFRQSMDVEHLSEVYNLIQSTGGTGAQVVTANAVGGGSNLYLAASMRAPRETFERRDHHPDDGPDRRMWPRAISRKQMDNWYLRVGARPARAPAVVEGGVEVGRAVGGHARRGRAHVRPRAARDRLRPLRGRQVVPHRLHLRRQEHRQHQLPGLRRARGRARAAQPPGRAHPPLGGQRDGYRYVVTASVMDNEGPSPTRQPAGQRGDRVQGADPRRGRDEHPADPDALARRPALAVGAGRAPPRA